VFNIFRKKSKLEELIKKDGIEGVTDVFSMLIVGKLTTPEMAYQFILQELDAASLGNATAIQFVESSGISQNEYSGALENSTPDIDGPNGPQQFLTVLSNDLSNNLELMVEFRCKIVEKVMKKFEIGKYMTTSKNQMLDPSNEKLAHLFQSLKNVLEDDKSVMPSLTLNIPIPAIAKENHIHFRQKNIDLAKELLSKLTKVTQYDEETIIRYALQHHDKAKKRQIQNDVMSRLSEMEKNSIAKERYRLSITIMKEMQDYSFILSGEEVDSAQELISIIGDLNKGDIVVTAYPYRSRDNF
jgi:hypothetical protein